MKIIFLFLFLPQLLLSSCDRNESKNQSYNGQKIVRLQLNSPADRAFIDALQLDIFNHSESDPTLTARVDSEQLAKLNQNQSIKTEVIVENLQDHLDRADAELKANQNDPKFFAHYHRSEKIYEFMNRLQSRFPDMLQSIELGRTHENRPIMAWKLTNRTHNSAVVKPAVLFTSLQHAREWVTTMVSPFLSERLLEAYASGDKVAIDIIDHFEVYMIPIMNPDGYEYSWDRDRYWRKNKNPKAAVDLNRNWSEGWGLDSGSSGRPREETYRGDHAFSEPETAAVQKFFKDMPNLVGHWDIHNPDQRLMNPWGFGSKASGFEEAFAFLGMDVVNALYTANQRIYPRGTPAEIYYLMSGGAMDYFHAEHQVLSYLIELPGPFELSPVEILPVVGEVSDGIIAYIQGLKKMADLDLLPAKKELFIFEAEKSDAEKTERKSSLYGYWTLESSVDDYDGLMTTILHLKEGQARIFKVCRKFNETLVAKVDTSLQLEGNFATFGKADLLATSPKGLKCKADFSEASFQYELLSNDMLSVDFHELGIDRRILRSTPVELRLLAAYQPSSNP